MTKSLICRNCDAKLGFIKKEYRQITRPGVFIVILLLFNIYYTIDPLMRALINLAVLIIWFWFFKRYVNYLKHAQLEVRE